MYKVIKGFTDLQDNNHVYNVGDVFPRNGAKVTESRIAQLASDANRQHVALIAEEKTKIAKETATDDGFNPAIPAQPDVVGQEAPLEEKPKRAYKKQESKNK